MLKPEHAYLHTTLRFETAAPFEVNARVYQLAALEAVLGLFGEAGFSAEVDVLRVCANGSAIFRVPNM